MTRPFASVVIPTRNRPEFVRAALHSLREQTCADFEVIVVDNHTGSPARHVFDELAAPGYRYLTPERPLAMHENWELGVGQATGEYVIVLIDKTVLIPCAIDVLRRVTARDPADVVTWRDEGYNLIPGDGYKVYTPTALGVQAPEAYDPRAELGHKISFAIRRGDAEGAHYYRGKICFGAFRRTLIERVRGALGSVFFPICPDYTSMVAALAYADSACDIGHPLQISAHTVISNGARYGTDPVAARAFLLDSDPTERVIEAMPISGLYASVHNLVAHDYAAMQRRVGDHLADVGLDPANLGLRALEDLHLVSWTDLGLRRDQYRMWKDHFDRLPVAARLHVLLRYADFLRQESTQRARSAVEREVGARLPRTARLLKRVLRRAPVSRARVCDSIQDAARAADQAYRTLV